MKFKMRKLYLFGSAFIGILASSISSSQAAECGAITLASMNWQSAEVLSNLDKIILEKGYGCDVTIITSDTVPAITSMIEKEQPDIVPEGWVDQVAEVFNRGLDEKRLVVLGNALADGGQHGWFIPQYMADAYPDIKTVDDALKHPELFPAPEDDSKGAIYNGPQGYGATVITTQLFKAYDAENKDFILIDPGSIAGLDGAISRAYEKKQGLLTFYWEPTSLLGRYKMVRLVGSMKHDPVEWKRCTSNPDCADPKPNEWPTDKAQTVVTSKFAEEAPVDVLNYLKKRTWHNSDVNTLLAWMSENQATGEDGAIYFLENNKNIWKEWVPEDVAQKIANSL